MEFERDLMEQNQYQQQALGQFKKLNKLCQVTSYRAFSRPRRFQKRRTGSNLGTFDMFRKVLISQWSVSIGLPPSTPYQWPLHSFWEHNL